MDTEAPGIVSSAVGSGAGGLVETVDGALREILANLQGLSRCCDLDGNGGKGNGSGLHCEKRSDGLIDKKCLEVIECSVVVDM